ncbi:MAG: alpha amylase C-terminal domain-containing protein, partial [Leptospirales bacterium]
MPGDMESRNSNLRLLISYMFSFPGKKLLFMGAELGRMTEWDFNSSLIKMAGIPHETPLQYLIKSLNGIYSTFRLGETDFSQKAFQWIDFNDSANTVISFIRRNDDAESMLVFVFTFTPVPREGYRIGIPEKGRYRSVFNSDSQAFGGKGYPERKVAVSGETEMHGFPWSLELDLPPLSCLIYMKEKEEMK